MPPEKYAKIKSMLDRGFSAHFITKECRESQQTVRRIQNGASSEDFPGRGNRSNSARRGREGTPGTALTEHLRVSVSAAQKAKWQAAAERQGVSLSELVRESVEELL